MATVFASVLIGMIDVFLLAAIVFILGSIISMFVALIHESVMVVEHEVTERHPNHDLAHHTHRLAFPH
ncbi:MAG: hypothetical protein WBI63_03815 [Coriobacteriia bacterium]